MNTKEVIQELSAILSQFQQLCPKLTPDNTDGQQADISDCTWRLSEVVEEMTLTTTIIDKEVSKR